MKKIVGYCRFRKGEKGSNYSIEEQKEAIEKYALEKEYQVVNIFTDENISGRKFERKGLEELMNHLYSNARNIDFLIVSDTTRIFAKPDNSWWIFKRFLLNQRVELISLLYYMPKHIQKQAEKHF